MQQQRGIIRAPLYFVLREDLSPIYVLFWMALFNPLTDHPVQLENVVMIHFWSIVLGIAAASLIFWLFGRNPKSVKTSVNNQKRLVPHTDDHDRFHSDIQNLQMAPEDLEIGPILGAGTFGQVFRGKLPQCTDDAHPNFPITTQCINVIVRQVVSGTQNSCPIYIKAFFLPWWRPLRG